MKLFLKGDRCFTPKCAIEKRNYPPGEHGQRRVKLTDYALQLREKQKLKRIYGVLEAQFRKYFQMAERQRGITGENLIKVLESRLDTVVCRLGFASSQAQARQLVRHGHFLVNGRKASIPSYLLRPGDVVEVRPRSREMVAIRGAIESAKKRPVPSWLELDLQNFKGVFEAPPSKEELPVSVNEQLVVALYSK